MAALARATAATASVVRNGVVQRVASASLVCGDMLVLTEGDAVSAEGMVHADVLHVQEASLTGESLPVTKNANTEPISSAGAGGDCAVGAAASGFGPSTLF